MLRNQRNPSAKAFGMLRFTPETAHNWAGPFPGGYAAFSILNFQGQPKLLESNDRYLLKFKGLIDGPTSKTPFSLRLFGNDDTSYSKFYGTLEEAQGELDLLLQAEPIRFEELKALGFVFTN